MSYLFQSRLFDDSGAIQVVLADTIPVSVPKYEEWACDSDGRSFVTYAPAVLPTTAQRRKLGSWLGGVSLAFNSSGSLYITNGSVSDPSDVKHDGVRIRKDGVLYVTTVSTAAVPVLNKRRNGFSIDSTGAVQVAGLSVVLNFGDLGSGAVDTATSLGTATPTFTRATAAASKLSTGLWKLDVASGTARYSYSGFDTTVTTTGGYLSEAARTNSCLQSRDLTNAAWTKTTMTTAKTSTGIDGVANSCTRCTASAGNATALQAVTLASAAKAFGVWIKRVTGTGEIDITLDNGVGWTNITSQINSSTYTLVQITQTLANPTVGIRIVTNADAIDVDVAQLEDTAAFSTSPIPTTAAPVARNADVWTETTGWLNAAAGTFYVTGRSPNSSAVSGTIFSINDTTQNEIYSFFRTASTTVGRFGVADGGVSQAGIDTGALANSATFKIAAAFAVNSFSAVSDAGTVGTDNTGTLPTVTTLYVGNDNNNTPFYGLISMMVGYNYRAKDANLTVMTNG